MDNTSNKIDLSTFLNKPESFDDPRTLGQHLFLKFNNEPTFDKKIKTKIGFY